jgi:hypothetical protein
MSRVIYQCPKCEQIVSDKAKYLGYKEKNIETVSPD